MKGVANNTVIETLAKIGPLFKELLRLYPEYFEEIITLLKYIFQTSRDVPTEELKDVISKVMPPEIGETAMTIAESLIQEGRREGEKGMFKTVQKMLQKQMNWNLIEELTGLSQQRFQEFSEKFKNEETEE